jgi:integrase
VAADAWLTSKKNDAKKDGREISASTTDFYQNIIKNHIKPVLGEYKLDEVTTDIAKATKAKWSVTLGISVNKVLMVCRSIWDEYDEVVPKNPWDKVRNAPRKDGRKASEIGEADPTKVYDAIEVAKLLRFAVTDQDRIMFRLGSEVGLRDGEALGLLMEHVTVDSIRVIQQWRCRNEYDDQGQPIFKRLKTDSGARTIKISKDLAQDLAAWKLAHKKNPWGLMFVNSRGRPCHRKDLSKAMARAIKNAHESGLKLKKLDYYSLRHHFASILIARGVNDVEIANLMGHKDSTVTRKVYAKFLKTESKYNPDEIFTPVPQTEVEQETEMLN